MVVLRSQKDLPTYQEVSRAIRIGDTRCIWRTERSGSRCSVKLTADEVKNAFRLTCAISRTKVIDAVPDALLRLVHLLSCDQYHRDYAKNHDADHRLANKWESELAMDALTDLSQSIARPRPKPPRITAEKSTNHDTVPADISTSEDINEGEGEISRLLDSLKLEDSVVDERFRSHKKLPDETVASKLVQRLGGGNRKGYEIGKQGFIYLFSQVSLRGMVKIGYTNLSVRSRLTHWSQCGHGTPILLKSFDRVPHAERVETLIHFELLSHWRKEICCHRHRTSHTEWFEIPESQAILVSTRWVSWMQSADPYDGVGDLKEPWTSTIRELSNNDIPITAQLLLDLWALEDPTRLGST